MMKTVKIIEIYNSVLGESTFSGLPATIIRFAGCNLRCKWCDSKFTYTRGYKYFMNDIISIVRKQKHNFVLITGGEPLFQRNAKSLIRKLLRSNKHVIVETNGSFLIPRLNSEKISWIIDIKTPSSGMHKHLNLENLINSRKFDEIKCVISNKEDFDYAIKKIKLIKKVPPSSILFSTVFGEMEAKELSSLLLHSKLNYRLQLQIHKIIWQPDERKV
ncbi:MAG: radical SAM protein [Candidatus Coatesbacteria bacterium]|nr:radical SAM protein [Candidatus Coatesbacteria bacterium]